MGSFFKIKLRLLRNVLVVAVLVHLHVANSVTIRSPLGEGTSKNDSESITTVYGRTRTNVKSDGEDATFTTRRNEEEEGMNDAVVGFAAEWEYKQYKENDLDGPSEAQHPEQQLSPSSLPLRKGMKGKLKSQFGSTNPSPSRRMGPGTWMDSNGYWWLYGGQGPTASVVSTSNQTSPINYLSDLWVYGPHDMSPISDAILPQTTTTLTDNPYWKLVYRPENDGESPTSSHPENVVFPLLCGSGKSGHLSLFRGHNTESQKSTFTTGNSVENHNSLFSEDGIVWLYDIPKRFQRISQKNMKSETIDCNWLKTNEQGAKRLCNETKSSEQSLWTSYICCDACIPSEEKTTFDFCPQFTKEPILWCNQDSLMAFQLTATTTSKKRKRSLESSLVQKVKQTESTTKGKQSTTSNFPSPPFTYSVTTKIPKVSQQRNITENAKNSVAAKMRESLTIKSHISQNITIQDFMRNGSNSQGVGQQLEKMNQGIEEENEKNVPENVTTHTNNTSKVAATAMRNNSNGSRKQEESTNSKEQVLEHGKVNNSSEKRRSGKNGPEVMPISTISSGESATMTSQLRNDDREEVEEKLVVNWWKFDLTSTEWMKMPEVNISAEDAEQVQSGNCRSVSDLEMLYILCPTTTNLLDRNVLLFDPRKSAIYKLGTIHLNNAFHDKKVWHMGQSTFHALRIDNQTVIFLAYRRLLDLWIHNHSSNKLFVVENVWKGSSLDAFQHTETFYKISIVLPSSIITKSTINGESLDENSVKGTKNIQHRSFYMVNPRSKQFSFNDPYPEAYFQISIVAARDVFLPVRDAPALINETDSRNKSSTNTHIHEGSSSSEDTTSFFNSAKLPSEIKEKTSNPYSQITIKNSSFSESKKDETLGENVTVASPHSSITNGPRLSDGLRKSQGLNRKSGERLSNPSLPVSETRSTTESNKGEMEETKEKVHEKTKISTITGTKELDRKSQSKFNPGPSTLRNYNKTNNSQWKGKVEVISGNKNKRILGIKRAFGEASESEGGVSLITHPVPVTTMSSSSSSSSSISGGNGNIISNWEPPNEMRSKKSRASLPVNNESSNRKPPPSSSTSTSSESHANSHSILPSPLAKSEPKLLSHWIVTSAENQRDHSSTTTTSVMMMLQKKQESPAEEAVKSTVNLPTTTPKTLILKVKTEKAARESQFNSHSLAANLETKIDDEKNSWTKPKNFSRKLSRIGSGDDKDENNNQHGSPLSRVPGMLKTTTDYDSDDEPNLENNYVSSRKAKAAANARKYETHRSENASFMGDMARAELSPLTYGSSEIVIDSPADDVQPISQEANSYYSSYSAFGSMLFFTLSLTFFGMVGLIVFVRRCVRCPPRNESVLIKEPPPIRYSVIDEQFHTPIV